jgi:hypothetical protein
MGESQRFAVRMPNWQIAENETLFLYGRARYTDVLGRKYLVGFGFKRITAAGSGNNLIGYGGIAYNYQRADDTPQDDLPEDRLQRL